MDHCLERRECDMCFRKMDIYSLLRLQITSADGLREVDNRVVCERCKDYIIDYWWRVEPTHLRYYHPA